MASRTGLAVCAVAALLLTGCQTPYVTPKPLVFQSRADDVSDWERLAYRTVDTYPFGDLSQKSAKFAQRFPLPAAKSDLPLGSTPFFVTYGGQDNCGTPAKCTETHSPFARAFKVLLEKALLDRGYTVVQNPRGALTLRFDAQSFLYDAHHNSHLLGSATVLSVLGTIGYQFRTITAVDTAFAAAAPSALVLDSLLALDDKTNAEVLISVTVSDDTAIKNAVTVADTDGAISNRRILYRNVETLYVKPSYLQFYMDGLPVSTLKVRGPDDEKR